jgi:hypothetical protein
VPSGASEYVVSVGVTEATSTTRAQTLAARAVSDRYRDVHARNPRVPPPPALVTAHGRFRPPRRSTPRGMSRRRHTFAPFCALLRVASPPFPNRQTPLK